MPNITDQIRGSVLPYIGQPSNLLNLLRARPLAQDRILPFDQLADMSIARDALKL